MSNALLPMSAPPGERLASRSAAASPVPRGGAAERELAPLIGRLFATIWLAFLLLPLAQLWQTHPSPARLSLPVLALLVFAAIYLTLALRGTFSVAARPGRMPPLTVALLLALAALATALSLVYGNSWGLLFIFVSVAVAMKLPARLALWGIAGVTLLTVGVNWRTGASLTDYLIALLSVGGLGIGMCGAVRLFDTIRELHAAREELARLAVTEERLRFARDLHDLLGHSLSLITLKSELAGRLVAVEPAQATAEIADVERVARAARRGARCARRWRATASPRSRRNWRGRARCSRRPISPAPSPTRLAYFLHRWMPCSAGRCARASRMSSAIAARGCEIRIARAGERVCCQIRDDGEGGASAVQAQQTPGNGLAGLAERVAASGGNVMAVEEGAV